MNVTTIQSEYAGKQAGFGGIAVQDIGNAGSPPPPRKKNLPTNPDPSIIAHLLVYPPSLPYES
jgi:hypothetical protein